MSQSCPNCGTALLDSDTQCFRCGAPAAGRAPNAQSTAGEKTNLGAAAVYTGVVLALAILGAVLANWMGAGYANPSGETPAPPIPAGWYECLSPQGDYRIWLPSSWHCYTRTSPEWEELAGQLTHPIPERFRRSAPPDQGERLSMIAQTRTTGGGRVPTVSIELYPGLAETALETLQEDRWWAGGRWVDTSEGLTIRRRASGETMLIADLIYPGGAGDYVESVTALLKTGRGVYAITFSGIEEESWRAEELLWDILDSFRPLDND
jgi:hypothetical protein